MNQTDHPRNTDLAPRREYFFGPRGNPTPNYIMYTGRRPKAHGKTENKSNRKMDDSKPNDLTDFQSLPAWPRRK